ncbi:hypothetical protein evm_009187 [Chilo suppressalis]|nr:hypothetical protein evm_009187 [Chilo suppressalis]
METISRKRANKRQQALLVETLHSNMELAREQLNLLGCRRTVKGWQHMWSMWCLKVKTKARKIRDHITATGGGPAAETLSSLEDKIIEVIGSATIYGFTSQEFPQLDIQNAEPSSTPQPQPSTSQESPPITVVQRRPRRRVPRGNNVRASETLLRAMENNNASFRQDMLTAAETLASAIRDAANILADQIRQSTLQISAVLADAQQVVVVSNPEQPDFSRRDTDLE